MNVLITYVKAQWDRVGAWVLISAGFIALFIGWLGISGTTILAGQMPYIVSGGMFGLALIGVGGMLWLSADLKDEWRKLDAIHEELAAGRPRASDIGQTRPAAQLEQDFIDLIGAPNHHAVRR